MPAQVPMKSRPQPHRSSVYVSIHVPPADCPQSGVSHDGLGPLRDTNSALKEQAARRGLPGSGQAAFSAGQGRPSQAPLGSTATHNARPFLHACSETR